MALSLDSSSLLWDLQDIHWISDLWEICSLLLKWESHKDQATTECLPSLLRKTRTKLIIFTAQDGLTTDKWGNRKTVPPMLLWITASAHAHLINAIRKTRHLHPPFPVQVAERSLPVRHRQAPTEGGSEAPLTPRRTAVANSGAGFSRVSHL